MRILEVERLLTSWFRACYNGGKPPLTDIDSQFIVEDAMNINEYWTYEVNNFKEISAKYKLNNNLYAKIKHWAPFERDVNKSIVLVYVYNEHDEFAFKVTVTVAYRNYKYFVSSNGSNLQVVAKHVILKDEKQVGLAVLTSPEFELKEVLSTNLHKVFIEKSPSFDGEEFYSVRFKTSKDFNHFANNVLSFRFCYAHTETKKKVFETRTIILDGFDEFHKPFEFYGKKVKVLDNKYPVALLRYKNKQSTLLSYPRNIEDFDFSHYEKVLFTDAQDNDWIL